MRIDWMSKAACKGLDTSEFFKNVWHIQHIKKLCETCPVRSECLDYSLVYVPEGFSGGMTASQRASERRRRGLKLHTWEPNTVRAQAEN